ETIGGYHLHGFIGTANGRVCDQSLAAVMGRCPEGDERTPGERRAAALMMIMSEALSSGKHEPSARIPRQSTMHVPYDTFASLIEACRSARPRDPDARPDGTNATGTGHQAGAADSAFGGASGSGAAGGDGASDRHGASAGNGRLDTGDGTSQNTTPGNPPVMDDAEWAVAWEPGFDGDHVISTRLDHRKLRGIDPATFSDGTPIPPALLARLACGSQLSRIVFG